MVEVKEGGMRVWMRKRSHDHDAGSDNGNDDEEYGTLVVPRTIQILCRELCCSHVGY